MKDNQKKEDLKAILKKLYNEIKDPILGYHVSLGNDLGTSRPPPPIGSGIFSKLSISSHIIYGILTAAHVVKDLILQSKSKICLSKPKNENTIVCTTSFSFIYCYINNKKFLDKSRAEYLPDIAFIALDVDKIPNNDLIIDSSFYDLDSNIDLVIDNSKIVSAFFRGAAEKNNGFLDTCLCIGGKEKLKSDKQTGVQLWEIPNTSNKSISGASGAGFWRFNCKKPQDIFLGGIIISEDSSKFSFIRAITNSYIYNNFLPDLKKYCKSFYKIS
ncbi:MAG: hypothetical protein ACFFG0_25275 [Candidatus Thorarchaeota archaeon]